MKADHLEAAINLQAELKKIDEALDLFEDKKITSKLTLGHPARNYLPSVDIDSKDAIIILQDRKIFLQTKISALGVQL